MKLDNFVELTNMQARCEICDNIYSRVTEKREGLCDVCNDVIDEALKDFEEKDLDNSEN